MSDQYQHVRNLPLLGVLSALGFTEWKARKNGSEWAGRCPVHQPKKNTGSFSFHADGRFQCFSCSAKGRGCIDLLMAIEKVNFRTAVERLEALSASIPAESAIVSAQDQTPVLTRNLAFSGSYEKFKVPSPWLEARGLLPATLERYEVFQYDNPKRRSQYSGSVLLKIRRWDDGECVGFLSRNIGEVTAERPKYTWPKGFRKSLELYGAWQIKNDVKQIPLRIAYVVESPFAVLKFSQLGLPAVSPFGCSVSPEQAHAMSQLARGWVFLPDADKFGEVAQSVALIARSSWVKTPRLPEGVTDPEHLTHDQIVALTASA